MLEHKLVSKCVLLLRRAGNDVSLQQGKSANSLCVSCEIQEKLQPCASVGGLSVCSTLAVRTTDLNVPVPFLTLVLDLEKILHWKGII